MHYYEFYFSGSEKLFAEGWTLIEDWEEDNVLSQTFYGKSEHKLENDEQAKAYLRDMFPVTDEYNVNLVNCLDEHTVNQLVHFFEIDASEFESSCGISTERDEDDSRYIVTLDYVMTAGIVVNADSAEDAEEKAMQYVHSKEGFDNYVRVAAPRNVLLGDGFTGDGFDVPIDAELLADGEIRDGMIEI